MAKTPKKPGGKSKLDVIVDLDPEVFKAAIGKALANKKVMVGFDLAADEEYPPVPAIPVIMIDGNNWASYTPQNEVVTNALLPSMNSDVMIMNVGGGHQTVFTNAKISNAKAKYETHLYMKGVDEKSGVKHDKEYDVSLVEVGKDKWAVPFAFGPAGKTKQTGVKVTGVSYGEANAIYGDLVQSKLDKGYKHKEGSPKTVSDDESAARQPGQPKAKTEGIPPPPPASFFEDTDGVKDKGDARYAASLAKGLYDLAKKGDVEGVKGYDVKGKILTGYKENILESMGHGGGQGTGKPCGESFISADKTCHVGEGVPVQTDVGPQGNKTLQQMGQALTGAAAKETNIEIGDVYHHMGGEDFTIVAKKPNGEVVLQSQSGETITGLEKTLKLAIAAGNYTKKSSVIDDLPVKVGDYIQTANQHPLKIYSFEGGKFTIQRMDGSFVPDISPTTIQHWMDPKLGFGYKKVPEPEGFGGNVVAKINDKFKYSADGQIYKVTEKGDNIDSTITLTGESNGAQIVFDSTKKFEQLVKDGAWSKVDSPPKPVFKSGDWVKTPGETQFWQIVSSGPNSYTLKSHEDGHTSSGYDKSNIETYIKGGLWEIVSGPPSKTPPAPTVAQSGASLKTIELPQSSIVLTGASGVDPSGWPAHNSAAQWGIKKIALMEKLFATGKYMELKAMDTAPKSQTPNKYQKGVHEAWKNLMKAAGQEIIQEIKNLGVVPNPAKEAEQLAKVDVKDAAGVVAEIKAINPNLNIGDDIIVASAWKKVGDQLGSNPGGQYEDENGQKWYVKQSKSNQHAVNEVLAAKLYEAAGQEVLPYKLAYLGGGKFGTATPWKPTQKFDPSSNMDKSAAQPAFATHAWLANWDALGVDNKNQQWVGEDDGTATHHKMTSVDVGGAMYFRAQGGVKGNKYGDVVNEWDTMRNPDIAPNCGPVFKDMTPKQLVDSAENVAAVSPEMITALVKHWNNGQLADDKSVADRLIARRADVIAKAEELNKKLDSPVKLQAAPPKPVPPSAPKLPSPPSTPDSVAQQAKIDHLKGGTPPPASAKVAGTTDQGIAAAMYSAAIAGNTSGIVAANPTTENGKKYQKMLLQMVNKVMALPPEQDAIKAILPQPHGVAFQKFPKKSSHLYHTASTGDMDALESIPAHDSAIASYKASLMDALKQHDAGKTTVKTTPEVPQHLKDITPGDATSPVAPSLPKPPQITSKSNAFTQKKFDDLYAAALTGDPSKVEAIETKADAKNTYSKQHHAYKMSLLAAMGVGEEKVSSAAQQAIPIVTGIGSGKATKGAIKLTDSTLPTESDWNGPFTSSNKTNVAQNLANMAEINKLAKLGDLDGIKAMPTFPSPKLENYKMLVIEKMTPPPPPPEPFKGKVADLDKLAPVKKLAEVDKKFEYLLVIGKTGVIQHNYGEGAWMTDSTGNYASGFNPGFSSWMSKNKELYSSLPSESKHAFSTLKGNFTSHNQALSAEQPTAQGIAAGKGIMKAGQVIPEGTHLLRYFSIGPKSLQELSEATGYVIQQGSVMETSIAKDWHWGGNVRMDLVAGPGVKGLYLGNTVSGCASECEMVLPPNTRFVVQEAKKVAGQLRVKAFLLPTVPHQFQSY